MKTTLPFMALIAIFVGICAGCTDDDSCERNGRCKPVREMINWRRDIYRFEYDASNRPLAVHFLEHRGFDFDCIFTYVQDSLYLEISDFVSDHTPMIGTLFVRAKLNRDGYVEYCDFRPGKKTEPATGHCDFTYSDGYLQRIERVVSGKQVYDYRWEKGNLVEVLHTSGEEEPDFRFALDYGDARLAVPMTLDQFYVGFDFTPVFTDLYRRTMHILGMCGLLGRPSRSIPLSCHYYKRSFHWDRPYFTQSYNYDFDDRGAVVVRYHAILNANWKELTFVY